MDLADEIILMAGDHAALMVLVIVSVATVASVLPMMRWAANWLWDIIRNGGRRI